MANKISVIIDVAVDKANASLGSFRKSIADADGAAGKFKAGVGGAFDAVKANAGNLAMVAGSAMVAFGVKAVSAFQDTALEAGRMSDALGLPVEDISRLTEVAGDLGIESGALEAALGKMNQTAGKTPAAFEAIGAEIVKTNTGATDVKGTFLETIDALNRIEDPARRAAAAQQIFGRSWRDSAVLIGLSSKQVTEAMASVTDAQAITDDEVRKARELQAALEDLKDAAGDVALEFGGELAPVVTDVAESAAESKNWFDKLRGSIPGLTTATSLLADNFARLIFWPKYLTDINDALHKTEETFGSLGASILDYTPATASAWEETEGLTEATNEMSEAAKRGTQQIKDAIAAYQSAEEAQRGMQSASLSYRQQVADTAAAVAESTLIQLDAKRTDEEREQSARDAEAAVLAQADAAVAFAEDQAAANGETLSADEKTKIYIDELYALAATLGGTARTEILAHIKRLQDIPKSIATDIAIRASVGYRGSTGGGLDGDPATPLAAGGIVKARPGGMLARIGEGGHDEAVIPLSGPNAPGMGASYHFTINNATDPDAVVRAIRQHVKRNGPIQGIT